MLSLGAREEGLELHLLQPAGTGGQRVAGPSAISAYLRGVLTSLNHGSLPPQRQRGPYLAGRCTPSAPSLLVWGQDDGEGEAGLGSLFSPPPLRGKITPMSPHSLLLAFTQHLS